MEFHEKDGAPLIVSEAQVITKATLEAAERLGLSTGDLATVSGSSILSARERHLSGGRSC